MEQAFVCDNDTRWYVYVPDFKNLDVTTATYILAEYGTSSSAFKNIVRKMIGSKDDWIKRRLDQVLFIVTECSDNENLERVVNATVSSQFRCFVSTYIQMKGTEFDSFDAYQTTWRYPTSIPRCVYKEDGLKKIGTAGNRHPVRASVCLGRRHCQDIISP